LYNSGELFESEFQGSTIISTGANSTAQYDLSYSKFLGNSIKLYGDGNFATPFSAIEYCELKNVLIENRRVTNPPDSIVTTLRHNNIGELFATGVLPAMLDFSDNEIREVANFDQVDFSSSTIVNFDRTDISKLMLKSRNFNISNLKDHFVQYPEESTKLMTTEKEWVIYQQLISTAKDNGRLEDAKMWDIKQRESKYLSLSKYSVLSKLSYWVEKYGWNFGYDKFRLVYYSMMLVVIFSLINFRNFNTLINEVYSEGKILNEWTKLKSKKGLKRAMQLPREFSLVFLYTSYLFYGFKLDYDQIHYTHLGWVVYILFVYSSGVLFLALILGHVLGL